MNTVIMMIFFTVIVGVVSFVVGRLYNESERILAEKRRVYEDFLRTLPMPNSAYLDMDEIECRDAIRPSEAAMPVLMLYGSPSVAKAIEVYITAYGEVSKLLSPNSPALAPEYIRLAKAQNDVILEMRRDALSWSVFAHRGASRVPL